MISIGNDIVTLDGHAARSSQPAFYSKILHPAERGLYREADFPHLSLENFVWLCWSVKESVYKCAKRMEPAILFSPRKIAMDAVVAQGSHSYQATGCFNGLPYRAWSTAGDQFIATVAITDAGDPDLHWGIHKITGVGYEDQSAAVRRFTLNQLRETIPGDGLSIGKAAAGYPVVLQDGLPLDILLSFSHHLNWVSYAYFTGAGRGNTIGRAMPSRS